MHVINEDNIIPQILMRAGLRNTNLVLWPHREIYAATFFPCMCLHVRIHHESMKLTTAKILCYSDLVSFRAFHPEDFLVEGGKREGAPIHTPMIKFSDC